MGPKAINQELPPVLDNTSLSPGCSSSSLSGFGLGMWLVTAPSKPFIGIHFTGIGNRMPICKIHGKMMSTPKRGQDLVAQTEVAEVRIHKICMGPTDLAQETGESRMGGQRRYPGFPVCLSPRN